jgi:NAD(P)-dependent dehydrogenase (short-subunit alcohol dehydrogenase family)
MAIAIVTGGSRGLGKNIAQHLAAKGVGVILTYNSKKTEADAVVAEIEKAGGKAAALQFNAGDSKTFPEFTNAVRDSLKSVWDTDKFNFLVNNAGIGVYSSILETTEEQFDTLFNIHVKGPFFLTQRLLPLIADGGRIINFSSGLTRFSYPGFAAYASAKGAVEVLTRYLAIETDFGGGQVRDNEQVNKFIASQTPLGRVGLPDDIGGVVAALLSDDTYWINAQRIEASGGIHS